jgi:DNA-binding transcriptional ArsR family regulator
MSARARADRIALLIEPRRQMLALLGEERTAGQLAACFALSRSAVSQHLGVLVEAKLVTCRRDERDGRLRRYRADRWALRELFLETWGELVEHT